MKTKEEIIKILKNDFTGANINAIPKIEKVVINVGAGKVTADPKFIEKVEADLVKITGQKPLKTLAKKSISGFKIRENMPIGLKVTLRGSRMFDFLTRLIDIALPRIRDFRGVKKSAVTKDGMVNIGIKEHIVFPEIKHDQVEKVFGFQINIVTTAKSREDAEKLLSAYGMVFEKDK